MKSAGKRVDGRRVTELRPVTIKRGYLKNAEGSALIQMGGTTVLCAATVEERVPPFLRNTGRGWVTAEYSMLPRSSAERIWSSGTRRARNRPTCTCNSPGGRRRATGRVRWRS